MKLGTTRASFENRFAGSSEDRRSQADIPGKMMKYLVLTSRKPQFDASSIPAHHQFLEELRSQGALEQAGPFTDASGGAYVLSAANLDEALSTIRRDPLHVQGCSTFDVREWNAK